jgi:hypothetical protein
LLGPQPALSCTTTATNKWIIGASVVNAPTVKAIIKSNHATELPRIELADRVSLSDHEQI